MPNSPLHVQLISQATCDQNAKILLDSNNYSSTANSIKCNNNPAATRVIIKINDEMKSPTNVHQIEMTSDPKTLILLSSKRFLILLLFCLYSMSNSFQWIEYAIITNVISEYYGVSNILVNWTSVIYMVLYIPGIVPASWFLDKYGLRLSIILGSFGTALGSWIKVFSVNPESFWITMTGQTVVATAQLFILNIPPRLAAVWFSSEEVSRATAIGVFGNQLGIAAGFLIPPLLVHTSNGPSSVSYGLNILFMSLALITTTIFVAILIFFDDKPKQPPSAAQALALENNENNSYMSSLSSLFGSKSFVLLLISYGLNAGVFYALSTVLNQLIEYSIPGHQTEAGIMGLIMTLAGIFGSVLGGYVLDATHKYKETTLAVYVLTLIGMVLFAACLRLASLWPLYFFSGFLGFFMTGYLPIGFEFAAEISYPNPEGTSAGLLNAGAQVCGIIFTFSASSVIDSYGDVPASIFFTLALALGLVITAVIKADLRRQNAAASVVAESKTEDSDNVSAL